MRKIAHLLLALSLLPALAVAAPGYEVLDTPQPTASEAVEVYEFFSYACPHCYQFRPLMEAWSEQAPEGVTIARVPVIFNESWALLAKAYYVADVLGAVEQTHKPLFEALHAEGRRFNDEQDVVDFYAELGLSRDRVAGAFDSFAVDMKMRQAERIARDYRVMSTPTVAVAGRYRVSPRTAGSQEHMIEVIDRLVGQELAKR
jgi:thiol:disulfide interchange protein DsbA